MEIIGARGKALGEVVRTPSAAPRASLHQEGEAARRELIRTEWLLSKPVLPANAATESWCGLLRVRPGRCQSYRACSSPLSVALGRRYPYRGGRPGRVVTEGVMPPDPKGLVDPVPRDADYPIPTVSCFQSSTCTNEPSGEDLCARFVVWK